MDSRAAVERAWERWAAGHGVDPVAVLAEAHGRRTIDTIRAVAPSLDAEAEARLLEDAESVDFAGVTALPGAAELLEALPSGSWAVVTSGTRALATGRLSHGGLPIPERLITANDVERGKPDPQPYLAGAAALSADPAQCLVIEDAPAGIEAGKAAGMTVLAMATTFEACALVAADYVVGSLADVVLRSAAELPDGRFSLELGVADEAGRPAFAGLPFP
ncbi:MAG: mannitol-/sugar-/sorbitol-6-phosphatase [Gaiellaceae bacterium]|jgi:sugar-phosphatase|nr:mannitol-/sugar-/sorbitol-6-phosphatase [Gaiellaceae bacterium]